MCAARAYENSEGLCRFAFKMDDPAFGWVPRAAARSPTRTAGTRPYYEYAEESDAAIAQHPRRTTKVYA